MKATPQQIAELKKRAAPINYSSVSVSDMGTLEKRSALLDQRIVEGYGCIWGVVNDYNEMFVRGCFSRSITDLGPGSNSNYQIKFRDEHGRACALFDALQEDETGLYFRTKPLDNVQWCDDLLVQLRSGTINNFSNGFKYIWDRVEWSEDDNCLVLLEARLFEISAVAIPSDIETFAIRSAEEKETLLDETEEFIIQLPKNKQLEARKMFARYKSLNEVSPPEQRHQAPNYVKPVEAGIDYQWLLTAIKETSLFTN